MLASQTDAVPPASARDLQGKFRPGRSGNPQGRKKGTRNRATLSAARLLEGEAEALTRTAVDLALSGDGPALRLCLERLLPPCREAPLQFAMPPLEGAADTVTAVQALIDAVARGDLTLGEAERLGKLVELKLRAIEIHELAERVSNLEQLL